MKKRILYLVVTCIATLSMSGQKLQETKANKSYEKFAYVDAIKTYERIYAKGYKSQEMLQRLGDSYYFKADLDNAAKWYGELFAFTQEVAPEYYYRYAQSLKAIKYYTKADAMLAVFNQKSSSDLRAKLAASQKDYLDLIKKNSGRYTIENAGINSKYSDYGSAFYKDKVVFTSARDTGGLGKRTHSWTGESFTNLYAAQMGAEGALSEASRFDNGLNSIFHESTPVFTKDGKRVYFTRNNFIDGKKGKDANQSTLLKLYTATLEGERWTNITELPFNSNDYSVAHPALSADDKTLYFASNMPGTLGQSDLFKVSVSADGTTYGTPINLGNVINTEGRETFPMITASNELYFASDGHPGLGGLDVFVTKAEQYGSFKHVLNVGEPLNSSKDDFGFLINDTTRLGYFSSNREGGQGGDDVYRFKEIKKFEQELAGIVIDKNTNLVLPGSKVTLLDDAFKVLKQTTADEQGNFDFGVVDLGTKYYVRAEKPEYTTSEIAVITLSIPGKTRVKMELEKESCKLIVGNDLAKCFGITKIYFDLDKSDIRPDAALELAKILDVLKQNPTLEIDIRSHTDSRQTAEYNIALSDRRAQSTLKWLVSNGVEAKRLTAKGYGESQLINECSDGVPCTEEQHQANRRSEFIITKI